MCIPALAAVKEICLVFRFLSSSYQHWLLRLGMLSLEEAASKSYLQSNLKL